MSMATDNTQQIPTAGDYYQQGAPTPPAPPMPPAGQSFQKQQPPRRERRGFVGTAGVALLAAGAASCTRPGAAPHANAVPSAPGRPGPDPLPWSGSPPRT